MADTVGSHGNTVDFLQIVKIDTEIGIVFCEYKIWNMY